MRFFQRFKPCAAIIMETELWPNLIDEAHARGVPVLLVNARLSERSARGYARIGSLTRAMLQKLRFIACQYSDHALRFKNLGATDEQVSALGSVKFDVVLPEDHVERVASLENVLALTGRRAWIAGSTHPGEDEVVLEAHRAVQKIDPSSCLLLVPRHPVRGAEIEALARQSGFTVTLA